MTSLLPPPAPTLAPPTPPATPGPGAPRHRRWPVIAGVVAAVVLVGGGMAFVATRGDEGAAAPVTTAVPPTAVPTPTTVGDVPPATVASSTTPVPTTVAAGPVIPLSDLIGARDVAGFVGPYPVPDVGDVAVLSRFGPDVGVDGTVKLAIAEAGSWRIAQVLPAGLVNAPVQVGDLTGDGVGEVVVSMSAMTVGRSWDVLYVVDPGPTLREVAFDTGALDAAGIEASSLHVDAVSTDHVETTLGSCDPTCADGRTRTMTWSLDRSAGWLLRPALGAGDPTVAGDAPGTCSAVSIGRDTGIAIEEPTCADGWAAAVRQGADCLEYECEGAEIFHVAAGTWVYVGGHYAVCSEALASATGMPASAAERLAMMSCEEPEQASVSVLIGDRGGEVSHVQQLLFNLGYAVEIDGQFGPGTEAAVRQFQAANGLTVDGQVGATTMSMLESLGTPGD